MQKQLDLNLGDSGDVVETSPQPFKTVFLSYYEEYRDGARYVRCTEQTVDNTYAPPDRGPLKSYRAYYL